MCATFPEKSGRDVVMVSLTLLTVKSLKTRFREPLRRAMRAALGWFTIAFGARCAGVLPAAGGVLSNTTSTQATLQCHDSNTTIITLLSICPLMESALVWNKVIQAQTGIKCSFMQQQCIKMNRESCTYWEEDWLGLCACCSSSLSPASKASREQCLSCKREETVKINLVMHFTFIWNWGSNTGARKCFFFKNSSISYHRQCGGSLTCRCVIKDSLCRGKGSHPSHWQWPPYTPFPPCCVAAW